jgi:hypothetical protein
MERDDDGDRGDNNNDNDDNNIIYYNKLLHVANILIENSCKIIYPRNIGFSRYIIINTCIK